MSDVTAVILTVGEPSTARALESVRAQRPPLADVVIVDGVTPFHRALNAGAARVGPPFFVQVDADMTLDPEGALLLREAMADGVGIVVGHLRDPLRGRVIGIKLFRTACFADGGMPDSVSPDTDFIDRAMRRGLSLVLARRALPGPPEAQDTFGEHRPDYTPHYTYCKYLLEGARFRYRRQGSGMRTAFADLARSSHPSARIAIVAAAHGVFQAEERDGLAPFPPSEEGEALARFFAGAAPAEAPAPSTRSRPAATSPRGSPSSAWATGRWPPRRRPTIASSPRSRFSCPRGRPISGSPGRGTCAASRAGRAAPRCRRADRTPR